MSEKIDRYVVEAKLLGKEKANGKKNKVRLYTNSFSMQSFLYFRLDTGLRYRGNPLR